MGYPYFIAAFSGILHLPLWLALWLVACGSSFAVVFLASRLFGTWVAAYFALTKFAWLQLSFLGGSEPLAVALGLAALWMFRRERIFWAALLGGLAVVVRPLMIFVLLGIGLTLLYRKRYKAFLLATATAMAIGALHSLPQAIYFHDPLATVHSYTSRDYGAAAVSGPHGHLFGWPFHAIVMGTLIYPAPWTNLIVSFFWIGLVLLGVVMMFSRRFREYAREHPNEAIFCGCYLLAVFCYDYLVWARGNFMRFCIPALPFVFYALLAWLPKRRWFIGLLAVGAPVLAAVSALGVKNVLGGR
jgi:hypothetical protein